MNDNVADINCRLSSGSRIGERQTSTMTNGSYAACDLQMSTTGFLSSSLGAPAHGGIIKTKSNRMRERANARITDAVDHPAFRPGQAPAQHTCAVFIDKLAQILLRIRI